MELTDALATHNLCSNPSLSYSDCVQSPPWMSYQITPH